MKRFLSGFLVLLLAMSALTPAALAEPEMSVSDVLKRIFPGASSDAKPTPTPAPEDEPDPNGQAAPTPHPNGDPDPNGPGATEPDADVSSPFCVDSGDVDGEWPVEEGDWHGEDIEFPPSLFDDNVQWITGSSTGNALDYAVIGNMALTIGYLTDHYCVIGVQDMGPDIPLTTSKPYNFVPAGDSFIYYGEHAKGKYGWIIKQAGNYAPEVLPLTVSDEVLYADATHIWYYSFGKGTSVTIRRMDHAGKNKKKLGTLNGRPVCMMEDERILYADFNKNRLCLWKDGKSETIYDPKEPIESVFSAGSDIWEQRADEIALIENGAPTFRIPGRMITNAASSAQLAMVVEPYPGSTYYDILLFNPGYRAWAKVGTIAAQAEVVVELRPYHITVWGPLASEYYALPEPNAYLPYGQFERDDLPVEADAPMASPGNEGWKQLLQGSWMASPSVGSGFNERLVITDTALYRIPNQMIGGRTTADRYEWTVENDELCLYQNAMLILRLALFGPYEVPERESPYSPSITIQGYASEPRVYYQCSTDPGYFEDLADYGIEVAARIADVPAWDEPVLDDPASDTSGQITLTLPAKLFSMYTEEAVIIAEYEPYGVTASRNADGSYTYVMTEAQRQEIVAVQRAGLDSTLAQLTTLEVYTPIFKAVDVNDDYSVIRLTVDASKMQDSIAGLVLMVIGLTVPGFQAFANCDPDPHSALILIDHKSGKEVGRFNLPDDFLT